MIERKCTYVSALEEQLAAEFCETDYEIVEKLGILIKAKWDSPTIKFELEQLWEHHEQLNDEINIELRKSESDENTSSDSE